MFNLINRLIPIPRDRSLNRARYSNVRYNSSLTSLQGFGPGTRARDLAYEFERYVQQTSIFR